MESLWVIEKECTEEVVNHLAKELAVPKVLSRILLKRGIDSFEKAKSYFRPELDKLHDPNLMKDMDLGVKRLHQALEKGEKILIYGDYDVDGVSGCSLLYLILSRMVGSKVSFYIPDRITEGYGLSKQGLQKCAEKGVSLIITIDCGVTAVEEIQFANELNVDVIVCDHHEPGESIPAAVAVLDPKRPDCSYPFKELAGVGVGFKFMQALYKHLGLPDSELDEYMDIVALGSCADIVPLVDENRILVRHGLDRINFNPRPGLKAIMQSARVDKREVNVGTVVFALAPRINAVGRMGDAGRAVRLIIAENLQRAAVLAKVLERENLTRRTVDETTFKEALEIVTNRLNPIEDHSFVVYQKGWHPGVIGIVASRIVEKFYRPSIVIAVDDDGIGKGSARSIASFNVYEAIKQSSQHLMAFGGHKYAAGLTIDEKNIPIFLKQFNDIARQQLSSEDLIPTTDVDCEVNLNDFDDRLIRLLKLMGPFGPLNLRPVFVSRNLNIVGEPSVVGTNHLKLRLEQSGKKMNAIGFNLGDRIDIINENSGVVDCAYVVEENHWNGRKEIQLRLKDIKTRTPGN